MCEIRRAAARAARRRGSSITMRRPSSHGSSSSRSGTNVVLPAPGGATRTAAPDSASERRNSSIVSSTGRSVIGIRSAECGSARERGGVPRCRNRRGSPRSGRSDRLGHRSPLDGRPTLSRCGDGSIGSDEDESWQRLESERAHGGPIRIREREKLTRQGSEELLDLVGARCHHEAGSSGGSAERSKNAGCRFENP